MVVGLGNPGRAYVHTPHNIGFEVVDRLAERLGGTWKASARFGCELATVGEVPTLLLAKPGLFMNRSGEVVAPLLRYRGLAPQDLVVVTDDLALPVGRMRIRSGGGCGGHRGMESIAQALGTEAFARLRVGVGAPDSAAEWAGHVLRAPPPEIRGRLQDMVRHAADAVVIITTFGIDEAMNRFNGFRLEDADA